MSSKWMKLISFAVRRKYLFDRKTVVDVLGSLKFDKNGNYKSIKAVCSDGKIRVVMLYKRQRGYYLRGYVCTNRDINLMGIVDTSRATSKFTNVGSMFIHDHSSINADFLPNWTIPGWVLPGRVDDIR